MSQIKSYNLRRTTAALSEQREKIDTVRNSDVMIKQWKAYQKDFEYVADIKFDEVCESVVQIMNVCDEV